MKSELGAMHWNCRPAIHRIQSYRAPVPMCRLKLGRVWWWVSTNIATAATLAHTYRSCHDRSQPVPQRSLLGIIARQPQRSPSSCSSVFE